MHRRTKIKGGLVLSRKGYYQSQVGLNIRLRADGRGSLPEAAWSKTPGDNAGWRRQNGAGATNPEIPQSCSGYLVEDAQKNMSLDGTVSLEAKEILREHDVCPPRQIKVVTGRGEFLEVAYDANFLPILPQNHPLSRMVMEEAHRMDHRGIEAMVMRS